MSKQWYFKDGVLGPEGGPVTSAELRRLRVQGIIKSNTYVRVAPKYNWKQAATIRGLFQEDVRPDSVSVLGSEEERNERISRPVIFTTIVSVLALIAFSAWMFNSLSVDRQRYANKALADELTMARSEIAKGQVPAAIERLRTALKDERATDRSDATRLLGSTLLKVGNQLLESGNATGSIEYLQEAAKYLPPGEGGASEELIENVRKLSSDEYAMTTLLTFSNDEFDAFRSYSDLPKRISLSNDEVYPNSWTVRLLILENEVRARLGAKECRDERQSWEGGSAAV